MGGPDGPTLGQLRLGSQLLVPLRVGTMCTGLLTLGRETPSRFTDQEIRAEVDLGEHVALTIRMSIGVANFPTDARSRPELIAYGDSSMYTVKEQGGGQVGTVHCGTCSLEPSVFGALCPPFGPYTRRTATPRSTPTSSRTTRFGEFMGLETVELEELMIRQHVVFSELMIRGGQHLHEVLAAVASHHGRWDGRGDTRTLRPARRSRSWAGSWRWPTRCPR